MDKALLDELKDDLTELTHRWSLHFTEADYVCVFCQRRPKTNDGDIEHASDCLGKRLQAALSKNTYLVAYNIGADFDIHTCKVEANTPHEALVAVLKDLCPALAETSSYEEAREAIVEQDNLAFSVTEI